MDFFTSPLLNGRPWLNTGFINSAGILFADGSAAAPSISFFNETTLGFYRSAAATVGLSGSLAISAALSAGQKISLTTFSGEALIAGITSGVSSVSFLTLRGTTAASVATTWYCGVNPFVGNAAFEIKDATGIGLQVQPVSGNLLLGTATDSANGRLQLATHTTTAGGIGIGTDCSLFRTGANALTLTATAGLTFRLNNAYAVGALVATGSLILTDSTGTNYRVPCLV